MAALATGAVHPLEVYAPPAQEGPQPVGGVNGLPRLAGTRRSVALRGAQVAAAAATVWVLLSAPEFAMFWQLRYDQSPLIDPCVVPQNAREHATKWRQPVARGTRCMDGGARKQRRKHQGMWDWDGITVECGR